MWKKMFQLQVFNKIKKTKQNPFLPTVTEVITSDLMISTEVKKQTAGVHKEENEVKNKQSYSLLLCSSPASQLVNLKTAFMFNHHNEVDIMQTYGGL
jgi:hypothetical protein